MAFLIGLALGLVLAVVLLRRMPWLAGRLGAATPPVQVEPERALCYGFGCTDADHVHPPVTG